jgi:hypothetical protein
MTAADIVSITICMANSLLLTRNGQAALLVLLRQLEGQLLGVVVDNLRLLEHQRQEALLAAREGLVDLARQRGDLAPLGRRRRRALLPGWRVAAPQVEVATREGGSANARVQDAVVAGLGRRIRRIAADVLCVCQRFVRALWVSEATYLLQLLGWAK